MWMSNVKMKKKKLSQSYGVLVCTAVVFVILFFNQFQLIEGSALAEEKTSRSGTVWAMNAQDLLANRKRREGEEEVATKKGEAEEKLRINNPRKKLEDEARANQGNQSATTREIFVKLPQNIGQMMPQSNDRQRMREAMLGFPPMPMPNSNESQEPTDKKADLARENDDQRTTTPSTENRSPSGRRKNTHPQQTRQNLKQGESDWTDQPASTVTQGTEKTTSAQTTRISNPDFEGAVWDGANKVSDKSDDGFSKKEPTNSRSVWSIAWEAHVYFSGTLFVLLSIYCSVNILRLHTFSRLFSRGYFVSLNLCLVVIGLLRPIWLFHDPYNFNQTWPRYGAYLLVDTGLPCMTTAFAVLFLALLRTTMIELVSPSFQTPGSLAIFCGCHFLLSFGVDITIGMFHHLRYMVLILQGVFIVWSLLLSAGYFYIFSAMNKVALRQQGDMLRSVYPKLILEGTVTYSESGHIQPMSSSILKKPPLARAVHLTLGVAILGSLLGGVQLFGMIKMLGLLKEDMTSSQNEWAWYGYQVSMRILEVTLCTLLAVIATTPLRSNFDLNGRISAANGTMMDGGMAFHHDMLGEQSLGLYALNNLPPISDDQGFFSRIFCCCRRQSPGHRQGRRDKGSWGSSSMCCTLCSDSNPPREFEDEIYSEICSNNQSVRQVMSSLAGTGGDVNHPFASTLGRQQPMPNGQAMGTMLPLGTLNTSNHLAIGSNTLLPYKRSNAAVNHYPSQSQTLLRSSNNYHDGGQGVRSQVGIHVQGPVNSMASSRATLDTALYSNVRSRPSSMLFNDSGFVRFRMGPDHGSNTTGAEVGMNQSNQELDRAEERSQPKRMSSKEREGLRASQSFDESILLMDMGIRLRDDKASPASQPETSLFDNGAGQKQGKNCNTSPVYNSASDQELRELDPKLGDLDTNLKDTDSESESDDDDEEEEGIYEPAPGTKQAKSKQNANTKKVNDSEQKENAQAPPSESDEPIYSGKSIYGRAPSQCSSVSATQSFDMRMYGRIPQPANQPKQHQLQQKPNGFGTLQKNEKLENPYYYYGSTRNQKKQKQQISKLQKPRPLLPSQRQALEFANRTPTFTTNVEQQRPKSQMDFQRPSSRQALLPQYHQEIIERQQRLQQQQQLQHQIQLQQQQQLQQQHQQQQQLQQHQQLQQLQQQQQNFQRSRSLGHHYQQQPQFFEPVRNQQILNHQQVQQPGSMTPGSYSRWHHSRQQQQLRSDDPYQSYNGGGKRYNPLYDTPPSQRHALLQQQQQQQLLRQHEHLAFMGEIRGVMGTPPTAKNQLKQGGPNQGLQQRLRLPSNSRQTAHQRGGRLIEPVLSPILTDQELSPLHRPGHPDFLTDQSESENEEDQATQGYSEGLADNEQDEEESEVSSLFGGQDLENLASPALTGLNGVSRPKRPAQPQQNPISPLQYSAMLKLYSTSADATAPRPEVGRKLSNSSSTGNTNNVNKKKNSFEGKEYSRLGTSEKECARVEPETVFSSSQSSAEDSDVQELTPPNSGKALSQRSDANMFRWDGSKISSEKTNDSDAKNANSGEIILNDAQSKKTHQA